MVHGKSDFCPTECCVSFFALARKIHTFRVGEGAWTFTWLVACEFVSAAFLLPYARRFLVIVRKEFPRERKDLAVGGMI
jgi:hypothetical protein